MQLQEVVQRNPVQFFFTKFPIMITFCNILQNLTSKWTLVQPTGIIQMSLVLIVNGFYNPF